jgi:hypothetical protein
LKPIPTDMRVWQKASDLLARDIAPFGGLASPLLCWLGALGLVLFAAWQAGRLIVGVRRAARPFVTLAPRLREMAERIEATDLARAYDRAHVDRRPTSPQTPDEEADVDRLRELDEAMREFDALRRPWIQFRKTLLIEHVPWFREPRVYSTRRAEEFFTPDAVLGRRIDLGFFGQVPSLITGLGLLLTFVAICIGLSRLHADGQSIAGIPGLINGLAGKFLTSIVGLICANLFVLLERPAVRSLLAARAELVALLDESFPRRTVEDLVDELRRADGRGREMRDALTGVIQSLEESQSRVQRQIASLVERLAAATAPEAAAPARAATAAPGRGAATAPEAGVRAQASAPGPAGVRRIERVSPNGTPAADPLAR